MRWIKFFLAFAIMGCSNALTTFSDQESDEALLFEAREAIRKGQWTNAINACSLIDAAMLTQESYAVTCASAFAGRCGFNVLDLVTLLQGVSGSVTVFELLVDELDSTTAQDVSDCEDAEAILHGIGGASIRSAEANGLAVLLGLYKVGVVLNELADPDEDGLPAGHNSCAMADDDTDMIATSFAEISDSLTLLASQSTFWDLLNTGMTAVCGAVEAQFDDTYNICKYTTGSFTTNLRKGVRTIVREGAMLGMDECTGDAPVPACNCP